MIYPIYEKKLSQEFYFTFYYYFKKLLKIHDIYVIIGYSFRDFSINDGFYYGLKSNSSSRMIVVNTNENVRRRVNEIFADQLNKIDFLPTKFGHQNFVSDLRRMLE